MPLSEALAARHHANRPWWRRAAQSIEHRIPPTLHGRWALSLPAATAVALVAIAGAAAGGWYLTRAQGTVVDVAGAATGSGGGGGGGNAGEATSTTQPPDDDHATPPSDTGAPPGDPRGKAGGTAAGRDGACHEHARTSAPPHAVPDAPTGWNAHVLRIVPVAAKDEPNGSAPKIWTPTERGSEPVARDGARMSPADAASAPAGWRLAEQASVLIARDGTRMSPAQATSAPASWYLTERESIPVVRSGARIFPAQATNVPVGWYLAEQARDGTQMSSVEGANLVAGRDSADQESVLFARDSVRTSPAHPANALAGGHSPEYMSAVPPTVATVAPTWLSARALELVPAATGAPKDRILAEQASDGARVSSASTLNALAGWSLTGQEKVLTVYVPRGAEISATVPAGVPHNRSSRERAHVLAAATPMGRWYRAPIARRYVEAMAASAAKRQSCSPHAAMATSPALAGAASAGAVVVDVEGKVVHPGIQMLSAGARVFEALAAAGGALPGVDVTALDLARPVADGEQLRVGIAGVPGPVVGLPQASVGGGSRGKRGRPAQPVDLNTATLEQLESVPDVGPSLAQRILDWRSEHGRFASVAQLRQVRGIGERKFADMRDSVTV
jgi:competence ComEA-like helix-hairpin-helix protein